MQLNISCAHHLTLEAALSKAIVNVLVLLVLLLGLASCALKIPSIFWLNF